MPKFTVVLSTAYSVEADTWESAPDVAREIARQFHGQQFVDDSWIDMIEEVED